MASEAPQGSQYDDHDDTKMNELLADEDESLKTFFDDSFYSMGLEENLLRGIYAYGFEKPPPSQQRGIVPLCKGLDVDHQAQSGTRRLDQCQAVGLAPTRELALQIEKVMKALGDYLGAKGEWKVDTLGDQHMNSSTQAHQKRFSHDLKCQLSKRGLLPTRLRKSGFRGAIKQPRKELH